MSEKKMKKRVICESDDIETVEKRTEKVSKVVNDSMKSIKKDKE